MEKLPLDDALTRADELLSSQNYLEASTVYEQIIQTQQKNPRLFHNAAIAKYKTEEIPLAIHYATQAVLLNRTNGEHKGLLNYLQNHASHNRAQKIQHPKEWAFQSYLWIRPVEFFGMASLLSLSAAFIYLFFQRKFRSFCISALSLAMLCSLLGWWTLGAKSIAWNSTSAGLRSAPLVSAETIMTIDPGSRFIVLRESGNFSEIERLNSFRGWIENKNIVFFIEK